MFYIHCKIKVKILQVWIKFYYLSKDEEAQKNFDKADIRRTLVDWDLRWVWNHSEVAVVLSGMNEMKQVEENIRTASEAEINSLTEKELKIVDEVKITIKEKVKVNCTACEYS